MLAVRDVNGEATDASASDSEMPACAIFRAPQSLAPSPHIPTQYLAEYTMITHGHNPHSPSTETIHKKWERQVPNQSSPVNHIQLNINIFIIMKSHIVKKFRTSSSSEHFIKRKRILSLYILKANLKVCFQRSLNDAVSHCPTDCGSRGDTPEILWPPKDFRHVNGTVSAPAADAENARDKSLGLMSHSLVFTWKRIYYYKTKCLSLSVLCLFICSAISPPVSNTNTNITQVYAWTV